MKNENKKIPYYRSVTVNVLPATDTLRVKLTEGSNRVLIVSDQFSRDIAIEYLIARGLSPIAVTCVKNDYVILFTGKSPL